MKSTLTLAALLCLLLVGCGSPSSKQTPNKCGVPAQAGCSLPKSKPTLAPPQAGRTFPDISEYQGCPRFSGPVIFKVYEGGYGQDHSALCNARRAHALGTWAGVYSFLRPTNCAGQGYATAQIVKQIGGVRGPVAADAEVPLPRGCVASFVASVRKTLGGPVDVYTSPGTWPGGPIPAPLWVATYGSRPGCVEGRCGHVAWQFSDNHPCNVGINTDCSIDSGILSQSRVPKPQPPSPRRAQIAYLRSLARRHHCYVPSVQHRVRACKVWGAEVKRLEGR